MEPIQKEKQTNKTSNTCTGDKGKQTNKQVEAACVEVQMQGVVQSCVTYGVQYTMHQSTQKSIRDALEKRRVRYTGSYSDNFIQSTEQINNRPGAPMFSLDMTAPSHSSLIAAPANLTAVM